jgi:hypothetical protein
MTIFNPYVILGFVLAMGTAFSGGYYKGKDSEYKRQQLEIAKLNSQARQKELALTTAVTQTATALRTSNEKQNRFQKSVIWLFPLVLYGCGFLPKQPTAPYKPPQMTPLPPEIAERREPNLTQRLLELLSPSQSQETKQSDNSQPVSKPINPLTTP